MAFLTAQDIAASWASYEEECNELFECLEKAMEAGPGDPDRAAACGLLIQHLRRAPLPQ